MIYGYSLDYKDQNEAETQWLTPVNVRMLLMVLVM